MKKILIFIIACCFCTNLANASQLPRYLGTEKKFRSYIYNPNDVYRYVGHYTYQGFIEFDEGESVSTISMGSPTLWLFEHLGNRLFLKPVGENSSETNMTVITNKHVYHFDLMAREAKSINDKELIFVVKFVYPDEKDKNIVQFPKTTPSDEPDLRDLSIYNFGYQYTGEPSIAPIKVFDNGEFTYFQFSKKNAEIPAIFTVDAAGFESLINFRAAGSYIIVERTAPQFTLRNGNEIVCVYNTTMYSNGKIKSPNVRADGGLMQLNGGSGFPNPANSTSPSIPVMPQMPPQMPPQSQMPSGQPNFSNPSMMPGPSGPAAMNGGMMMPPGMSSGGFPTMPAAGNPQSGMMLPPPEAMSMPLPGIGRIQ